MSDIKIENMPEMTNAQLEEKKLEALKVLSTHTPATAPVIPGVAPQPNEHPLHQYDFKIMNKFYESCVNKMQEQVPEWKPTEWTKATPMPATLTPEQRLQWANPMVLSQKQRVYEQFARFARETGEPMILLPSFDYGDIINFSKFLQALRNDGINAINKYKQYLNNKDIRKFEVDLVVMHPKWGVILVEVKDCDHLDNKRRNRARIQLTNALSCFETMARLIFEAKGWSQKEAYVPIMEFIALPNVQERPMPYVKTRGESQHNTSQQHNQSGMNSTANSSTVSETSSRSLNKNQRSLNYLIKSDMESQATFRQWWTKYIVEPRMEKQQQMEQDQVVNKFDTSVLNWMNGLINCIRKNLIMPVVYKEDGVEEAILNTVMPTAGEPKPTEEEQEKINFQQALKVHGEFLTADHEAVRSQSKVVVVAQEAEKIRKIICLQTLWLLSNDSQKKISVVCSEMNKQYYEEFFARQRKLYNDLHNVRFYTDLQSCTVNNQHTLKQAGEMWFFDSDLNGKFSDVMERARELSTFWLFTTKEEELAQYKQELDTQLNAKFMHMKADKSDAVNMPWLSGASLKFPLRLQCDLLIIGDIVGPVQVKVMQHLMKTNSVDNMSHLYNTHHNNNDRHHNHRNNQNNQGRHHQQQQLHFNPLKKFKTIKFIRGGSIDNLRSALKMHDSVHAPVIMMHVGDEDLFKTRDANAVVERVKEMTTLVKEYCPKSFVLLSTLMKRMSRTENSVTNEVNKGIMQFCKETKDTKNVFYMLNSLFEPDYHTQEGRVLKKKGLKMFVENMLFSVDYFMMKNNKQM